MNTTIKTGGAIMLISAALFFVFVSVRTPHEEVVPPPYETSVSTSTPSVPEKPQPLPPVTENHLLPYGEVSLKLGARADFKAISIRPLSLVEDSRCPIDVQCIQAGTVRVSIQIISVTGTQTEIVKFGEVFLHEGMSITLAGVEPNKNTKVTTRNSDYVFVFTVAPQEIVKAPISKGKCYVGGCSSQVCSDRQDVVTTCEYRDSYACYKTATCERQSSGECGWTDTPELSTCLASPSPVQ